VPYTLIEGPCAWYGRDYTSEQQQQQFVLQLTPVHIQELDAALEQVLASGLVQQQGDYLRFVSAPPVTLPCMDLIPAAAGAVLAASIASSPQQSARY
jgi:hypothetical protein